MGKLKWAFTAIALLLVIVLQASRPSAAIRGSFHLAMPKPWELITLESVDQAWRLPNDKANSTVTVTVEATDEPLTPPNSAQEAALVDGIMRERAFALRIFGIHDLKCASHRIVHQNDKSFYIEMIGSYVPARNVRVGFMERDYFVGATAYSVAYSRDLLDGDRSGEKLEAARTSQLATPLLDAFGTPEGAQ